MKSSMTVEVVAAVFQLLQLQVTQTQARNFGMQRAVLAMVLLAKVFPDRGLY